MAECSLCDAPMPGAFCERCYPEHVPRGPSPQAAAPGATPQGRREARIALAFAVVGVAVICFSASYLVVSSVFTPTYEVNGVGLTGILADARERGTLPDWRPGTTVEVAGILTAVEGARGGGTSESGSTGDARRVGLRLQLDGAEETVLVLGADPQRFVPGAQVVFTLTVVALASPHTGQEILWFAEDLNAVFPGALVLDSARVSVEA